MAKETLIVAPPWIYSQLIRNFQATPRKRQWGICSYQIAVTSAVELYILNFLFWKFCSAQRFLSRFCPGFIPKFQWLFPYFLSQFHWRIFPHGDRVPTLTSRFPGRRVGLRREPPCSAPFDTAGYNKGFSSVPKLHSMKNLRLSSTHDRQIIKITYS